MALFRINFKYNQIPTLHKLLKFDNYISKDNY